MSDFIEQLKLLEQAAENIYFAKVNRVVESLHIQMQVEKFPFYLPSNPVPNEERKTVAS